MTLTPIWSVVGAWSSGILSLIAGHQRHVGFSRRPCARSILVASLDVSKLAVFVSLRLSTLLSWRLWFCRRRRFGSKDRLNLPYHSSTQFAGPLKGFFVLNCCLLGFINSFGNRQITHPSLSTPSNRNKFIKRLAFLFYVPRLIFDYGFQSLPKQ